MIWPFNKLEDEQQTKLTQYWKNKHDEQLQAHQNTILDFEKKITAKNDMLNLNDLQLKSYENKFNLYLDRIEKQNDEIADLNDKLKKALTRSKPKKRGRPSKDKKI